VFLARTLNLSPFYRCIVALYFPSAQVLFFRGMILPISVVVTVFWPATFPRAISADGVIQSDFAAKRRTRRHAEGTGFTKPNGKGVVGPDAPQPAGLEAEAAEIETCRG
jgi:hypothetical protein